MDFNEIWYRGILPTKIYRRLIILFDMRARGEVSNGHLHKVLFVTRNRFISLFVKYTFNSKNIQLTSYPLRVSRSHDAVF
jgi:hypothetical protein